MHASATVWLLPELGPSRDLGCMSWPGWWWRIPWQACLVQGLHCQAQVVVVLTQQCHSMPVS